MYRGKGIENLNGFILVVTTGKENNLYDFFFFLISDVTLRCHRLWVCPWVEPQLALLVQVKQKQQRTWVVVLESMLWSLTVQIRWTSEVLAVFTKVNQPLIFKVTFIV